MHIFYYPELMTGDTVLPEQEAWHGIRVLRLRKGDMIGITDGKGNFVKASILEADAKNCRFQVFESFSGYGYRSFHLHIAIAPTQQQERFEWFAEKATELGADRITPILCERSERTRLRHDRLERILIAAMKQAGRAYLPELNELIPFPHLVKSGQDRFRFIAHCMPGKKKYLAECIPPAEDILVAIGPEGDFTANELDMAIQHQFLPVSLGETRLRTETAGIAACCAFQMAQLPARKSST